MNRRAARVPWWVGLVLVAGACSPGEVARPTEIEVAAATPTPDAPAVATPTRPAQPTAVPAPTALDIPSPVPVEEPTVTAAAPTPTVEPTVGAVEVEAEAPRPTVAPAPTAPASPTAPPPTALPAASDTDSLAARVANGGEVYTLNCARCHGENGLGTAQYRGIFGVGNLYTTAGMIDELTNGHPVTFGFADRLSADEIASVVAFVKATFP